MSASTGRVQARTLGSSPYLYQAVRTVPGATHQAARPVVLEGTAEDANAGGSQCRGNGIAGVGRVALPIEGKWEVHITLD